MRRIPGASAGSQVRRSGEPRGPAVVGTPSSTNPETTNRLPVIRNGGRVSTDMRMPR